MDWILFCGLMGRQKWYFANFLDFGVLRTLLLVIVGYLRCFAYFVAFGCFWWFELFLSFCVGLGICWFVCWWCFLGG